MDTTPRASLETPRVYPARTMADGRTVTMVDIGRHRFHIALRTTPGADMNGRPLGTTYWIRRDNPCPDEDAALAAAVADCARMAAGAREPWQQ